MSKCFASRLKIGLLYKAPRRVRQHYFVETDHEIFHTAIFFLQLIQEGQLSVSGERMRTHIGESLRRLSQSRKSAVR